MENKICLDTDFLINLLRNKEAEREYVLEAEQGATLATTYINLFELYYGAYKSKDMEKGLKALMLLTKKLVLLNMTAESARKAGQILSELEKQGKSIDFRDLLIGTVAAENNFLMKTGNTKHFKMIDGLKFSH